MQTMQALKITNRWAFRTIAVLALAVTVSAGLACGQAPPAAKKFEPTKFTQIKKDASGKPLALQQATVRYVPAKANPANEGLSVDLVGVIHIADRQFYEQLNVLFKDYDVVLWEGVKGEPNNKLLAEVMKKWLDHDTRAKQLGFVAQHHVIDYKAANFVHADVSWQEWGQRIKKDGGWLSLAPLVAKDFAKLMKARKEMKPDSPAKEPAQEKIQWAETLAKSQNGKEMGETLYRLLIEMRNDACIEVLEKQIAAGKKKIAIFYGSAHMPDFERRLLQDFGLQRDSVRWFDAWDLTAEKLAPIGG
jgi:hypothetical protein